ncbi:MAG: nodulation protein NfeD [Candidatus Desulfofervidaceae bacterium]|nr:nodulation protein NfeD [Candidatus Desulfofervidaceae bacterium]
MKKLVSLFSLCFLLASWAYGEEIFLLKVEEVISPAVGELITMAVEQAEKSGGECLVIELDTPGGLAASMQQIVKTILNSPIPIVVYVAPSGAKAASAGAIITLSAHIAAMASGTNIGAAHPVNLGGKKLSKEMTEKVVNDMVAYVKGIASKHNRNAKIAEKMVRESVSLTAKEALKEKVIDLLADSLPDLLQKIDNRKVSLPTGEKILHTKTAKIIEIKGDLRYQILRILSNPNIAYLLMMVGLAGLYFELANPGAIFPGVIGAISLVLAFFAFQTLPVNYAGILLILLGIIFFILELKITSYGLLTIAAIFCYALGSLMLFHHAPGYLRISLKVMLTTLISISLFFISIMLLVIKAQTSRVKIGKEALIGEAGEVIEDISPGKLGKIFVHGEYWNAESDEAIKKGEKVKVVQVNGLKIKVRKI